MKTTTHKRPAKLASASAYFRIAAKFERSGNFAQALHYRGVADRLVAAHRRDVEAAQRRQALQATQIRSYKP
jgi:hypothetical protein